MNNYGIMANCIETYLCFPSQGSYNTLKLVFLNICSGLWSHLMHKQKPTTIIWTDQMPYVTGFSKPAPYTHNGKERFHGQSVAPY